MEPQASQHNAPESEPRPTYADAQPSGNGHDASAAESLKKVGLHLGELKEYASLYVAAKLDSLKLTMRTVALFAVLGIVGGIVGIGLLITAAALLLTGIAGGIGAIFDPDQYWVGALIVGLVVIAGAVGGVVLVMRKLTGASRKATLKKYEDRKRAERASFGHDVQERAREQAQRQPQP